MLDIRKSTLKVAIHKNFFIQYLMGVINPVIERLRPPQRIGVIEFKQIDALSRVGMRTGVHLVLTVSSVNRNNFM